MRCDICHVDTAVPSGQDHGMKLRANEVILIKLDERPNASMAPWTITFSPDGAKWHRLYAETRSGGIRSAKRYLRRLRKASVIKA